MKCLKCDNTAEIQFPNGDLCPSCFLEILTNRIKKDVRQNIPFKKGEKVLVFGKITNSFLKRIVGALPLDITTSNKRFGEDVNDFSSYDKVVIPWTADDEALLFYTEITKKNPRLNKNKLIVELFRTVLDDELIKAAKILKIKIKLKSKRKELEKIHKKFPNSIFGLRKSAEEFMKAVK